MEIRCKTNDGINPSRYCKLISIAGEILVLQDILNDNLVLGYMDRITNLEIYNENTNDRWIIRALGGSGMAFSCDTNSFSLDKLQWTQFDNEYIANQFIESRNMDFVAIAEKLELEEKDDNE